MANVLRWTDRAEEEYNKLIDYLNGEWGPEITGRIIGEFKQSIARIQNSPEQFPIFLKAKKTRRCVVSPQTSIFFKVYKEEIRILTVFDNRQNPRKRKL